MHTNLQLLSLFLSATLVGQHTFHQLEKPLNTAWKLQTSNWNSKRQTTTSARTIKKHTHQPWIKKADYQQKPRGWCDVCN